MLAFPLELLVAESRIHNGESHHKWLLLVHRLGQMRPWRDHAGQVVKLDPGGAFQVSQPFENCLAQVVDLLVRVFVLDDLDWEVDLLVVAVALVEGVVFGDVVVNLDAQSHSGLVGPAPCHVLDGVSASADHHRGDGKTEHKLKTARMALDAKIEHAELVVAETISAKLHEQRVGTELAHHSRHYVLEELEEAVIRDAGLERDIEGKLLAVALALLEEPTSAGEELITVLVEGDGHAAVGEVEGLLNAVAVMHVDVEVEHARVDVQQLDDRQHDVIHVAETARLRLLRVVQAASPVYGDVRLPVQQQAGGVDGGARRDLAEVVEAVEGGTVSRLSDLESLALLEILEAARVGGGVGEAIDAHVVELAGDVPADELLEVVEVVLGVEAPHFVAAGLPRVVNVEVAVEARIDHQGVRHCDPLRLHRVLLRVDELPEVLVVEVGHLPLPLSIHQYNCTKHIQLPILSPPSSSTHDWKPHYPAGHGIPRK